MGACASAVVVRAMGKLDDDTISRVVWVDVCGSTDAAVVPSIGVFAVELS